MWKRVSQVRLYTLIVGLMLFFFVYKIGGNVWNDWQTWSEISRDPVTTEATVINNVMAISNDSGKIQKYDVTYEFVAPAAAGGSNTSRAELNKRLQDQIYNQPGSRAQPSEPMTARTDGNQYFSRTQPVDSNFFGARSGSAPIPIVYARANPQNSLIAGTGGYPTGYALLLAALLLIGAYLLYLAVAPVFRASLPARI